MTWKLEVTCEDDDLNVAMTHPNDAFVYTVREYVKSTVTIDYVTVLLTDAIDEKDYYPTVREIDVDGNVSYPSETYDDAAEITRQIVSEKLTYVHVKEVLNNYFE